MPRNLRYPHLLPVDVPVWERFLQLHGAEYTSIDYDVRVGRGRDAPAGSEPNIQQMALDLSMRRIDAVGHRPDFIDIIEITRIAGIHALGQMIAYPLLYAITHKSTKTLRKIIVAESLGPDVHDSFIANNIIIRLFPPKEAPIEV